MNRHLQQRTVLARLVPTLLTMHLVALGLLGVQAQRGSVVASARRPAAGYPLVARDGAIAGNTLAPRSNINYQSPMHIGQASNDNGYACYLPAVWRQSTPAAPPAPTATQHPAGTPTASLTPIPSASPTATHPPTATPAPTPTSTLPPLVIGHITDAHIGGSDGWVYSQRLPGVVRLVSQRADVMVDTGDCSDDGREDTTIEYLDLVTSNVTIPWRAVMGNHDTPIHFERHIGPLDWSWDVGGYRLIGINTEAINYIALDQALTTQKPCIIFGHFPLSWCTPTDQDKLRQRFQTFDVPIYVAGHTHQDSLETDPLSGTLLLTGQRAGMGHYRLITVQGFEVETVTFECGW